MRELIRRWFPLRSQASGRNSSAGPLKMQCRFTRRDRREGSSWAGAFREGLHRGLGQVAGRKRKGNLKARRIGNGTVCRRGGPGAEKMRAGGKTGEGKIISMIPPNGAGTR
eukprot:g19547.t1